MESMIACGYCRCGCGQKTEVAWRTRSRMGWVKGEPKPYAPGHQRRRVGTIAEHPYDPDAAVVELTKGFVAVIDLADIPLVSQHAWHVREAEYGGPYASSATGGLMHRLIMGVGDGEDVDHVDGDGLNNRRGNLRPVNGAQNSANRKLPANSSSGFKGVTLRPSGTWEVHIQKRYVGRFPSEIEAASAYDDEARRTFGPYARLNFPRPGEMGCR